MQTAKKLHWTQLPENKEKVKAMAEKGASTRRKVNVKRKHSTKGKAEAHQDSRIVYAFAHVEAWIELYADSVELPRSIVTEQVAELLLLQVRGKRMGTRNSMS